MIRVGLIGAVAVVLLASAPGYAQPAPTEPAGGGESDDTTDGTAGGSLPAETKPLAPKLDVGVKPEPDESEAAEPEPESEPTEHEAEAEADESETDESESPSGDIVDPREIKRQAERDAQRAHEEAVVRESLPEIEPPDAPAWERHIEIGASLAFVVRPFAEGLGETLTGYDPGFGFGVHLQWPVLEWLRVQPYFMHVFQNINIPQGALQTGTARSISPGATVSEASAATFILGAKIAPTWNITGRLRGWLAVGIGWGRFEIPAMTATETNGTSYEIRARSGVVVEFPIGLGLQFDVIERWLAIHFETSAAPITGQSGTAHENFQAVDADGEILDIGPLGAAEVSFVQTLGLSLIL